MPRWLPLYDGQQTYIPIKVNVTFPLEAVKFKG